MEKDEKVGDVLLGLLNYANSLEDTDFKDKKAALSIISKLKREKIQAGKSNGESEQNQTINRIEFEIPVALPVMGKWNYFLNGGVKFFISF